MFAICSALSIKDANVPDKDSFNDLVTVSIDLGITVFTKLSVINLSGEPANVINIFPPIDLFNSAKPPVRSLILAVTILKYCAKSGIPSAPTISSYLILSDDDFFSTE